MPDVTFNEETEQTRYATPSREPRGLFKLAIRLGLAKDENQARGVLIAVALIALAIAILYPLFIAYV